MKKGISILLLSVMLFTNLLAEETAEKEPKIEVKTYHVYDDIDLISAQKIVYGKPRIVIRAVYPQLISENENPVIELFNQTVLDIVQNEIEGFEQIVSHYYDRQKQYKKRRNDLYIDYDSSIVETRHTHIASIRFTIKGVMTGITQPYRFHKVFNFDLEQGQTIALKDLFKNEDYLEPIASYAQDILLKRLKHSNNVLEETAPYENNYQVWNLKPNGLLITFDKAANSLIGAQSVLIPFSVLKPFISKESLISNCAHAKGACLRRRLLTGGFIDEAKNNAKTNSNTKKTMRL